MSSRPDRILIGTPIVQDKLYAFPDFVAALQGQQTSLLWDLLLVDNTPQPDPGYLKWLDDWIASKPFGPTHRIRKARFGEDVDGQTIWHPLFRVLEAESIIVRRFVKWSSYDHLLFMECDVVPPPHALQTLYDSGFDWAASWMLTRRMTDPFDKDDKTIHRFPLLFHSLDLDAWANLPNWDAICATGYMEPPGSEPFPCIVTHLGCTLLRGQMVREVPFPMTIHGGDVAYSWATKAAGYQPMCVPAVDCEHLASSERPEFKPWATPLRPETAKSMPAMAPLGGK